MGTSRSRARSAESSLSAMPSQPGQEAKSGSSIGRQTEQLDRVWIEEARTNPLRRLRRPTRRPRTRSAAVRRRGIDASLAYNTGAQEMNPPPLSARGIAARAGAFFAVLAALLALTLQPASAGVVDGVQTVDDLVIYLGVVPAAVTRGHARQHPERTMHGGSERTGL